MRISLEEETAATVLKERRERPRSNVVGVVNDEPYDPGELVGAKGAASMQGSLAGAIVTHPCLQILLRNQ
jgi:hypothetical protein